VTTLAVVSDLHLDAGATLGNPDLVYGSSRIRDAKALLEHVVRDAMEKGATGLVFAGDLARTAEPGPTPYRVAQEAFSQFEGPIWMLLGNHDYAATAARNLDVVAAACGATVVDRPGIDAQTLPVGLAFLPWSPPIRLFDKAPHRPHSWNAIVGERLHDLIRGLAADLEPAGRPRVLIGHWLVAGEKLASGRDVIEAHEPLIDAAVIEQAGFELAVFGHNHVAAQVSERVWSCGPPMRGSFGEAELPVGYMLIHVEDDAARGEHVEIQDRALLTMDLDVGGDNPIPAGVAGAVVRVRYVCREDQVRPMAQVFKRLSARLTEAGASKIVGPQVTVQRVRRERERVEVDASPRAALERYLEVQEITGELREAVLREAAAIVGEAELDEGQLVLEEEPW
jgi:DNA repair exonuclease SbcCD nuclease subunit